MKANRLDRLERFLVGLISGGDPGEHSRAVLAFLWVLKQLARLYRCVIQLRLFLYAKGIFRHYTLGCQVISVGNLTVGGTGKTPVVEVFARELQREGRRVAILSRGYKKQKAPLVQRILDVVLFREQRRPPRVVSDGDRPLLDSAMSGDEPYMLASNLDGVVVLVDSDRVKSGRYAVTKFGCDTLVLDDGFQHLRLKHRVEIVLVDRTDPFGNEHVLPRGILREPAKNISRAHFMFITKSDGTDTGPLRNRLRQYNPKAEIIECRHCARHLQNVITSERRELEFLDGANVVCVSGIAVPAGFEREVEKRGATILDRNRFADHHRYSRQEIVDIINRGKRLGADAVITTEKDAVRFPRLDGDPLPIYFLRVEIEILTGEEDFRACISRICFR